MPQNVFLAISYANEYKWVRNAIAQACRRAGDNLWIVDEKTNPDEMIVPLMYEMMSKCDVGVVVASSLNPNVMHEHGFMKARKKKLIVAFDENTKLPFDLAGISAISYCTPNNLSDEKLMEVCSEALASRIELELKGFGNHHKIEDDNEGVKKRVVFGYFYYCIEGFERIMIHRAQAEMWNFPLQGTFTENVPIRKALDHLIFQFINTSPEHRKWFNKVGFCSPEIFEIYPSDKKRSKDKHREEPLPVFFKIKITNVGCRSFFASEGYCWALKSLLFRKMRLCIVGSEPECIDMGDCKPESPELLWYVRNDKILLEHGLKVLEGVDVITYKKIHTTKKEDKKTSGGGGAKTFFMLHRRENDPNSVMWEYPKGGLEYHESFQEGAIRELLEETGVDTIGVYRFGGDLSYTTPAITPDVSSRKEKHYNTLRLHGLTYRFIDDKNINNPQPHHCSIEHDGDNRDDWWHFNKAQDKVWMSYGKLFFKIWKEKETEIDVCAAPPVSMAYQITEKCPHTCRYCHRRIANENILEKNDKIYKMIDLIGKRKLLRLTFTGGEPLLIGKKRLFSVIKYASERKIHTCLSTTGIAGKNADERLSENDLESLAPILDSLLVSLNCIDRQYAADTYSSIDDWEDLFNMVMFLIRPRNLGIIVEVCTAVTKCNIESVEKIGDFLFSSNSSLLWRIDEYYPNGKQNEYKDKFELMDGQFERLKERLMDRFSEYIKKKQIRFNSKIERKIAPDIMVTPQINLVTSSKNTYNLIGDMQNLSTSSFENRRSYTDYRAYCRRWVWDIQCDWEGYSGEDVFFEEHEKFIEEK